MKKGEKKMEGKKSCPKAIRKQTKNNVFTSLTPAIPRFSLTAFKKKRIIWLGSPPLLDDGTK